MGREGERERNKNIPGGNVAVEGDVAEMKIRDRLPSS